MFGSDDVSCGVLASVQKRAGKIIICFLSNLEYSTTPRPSPENPAPPYPEPCALLTTRVSSNPRIYAPASRAFKSLRVSERDCRCATPQELAKDQPGRQRSSTARCHSGSSREVNHQAYD